MHALPRLARVGRHRSALAQWANGGCRDNAKEAPNDGTRGFVAVLAMAPASSNCQQVGDQPSLVSKLDAARPTSTGTNDRIAGLERLDSTITDQRK
jgi:hypothetical protein